MNRRFIYKSQSRKRNQENQQDKDNKENNLQLNNSHLLNNKVKLKRKSLIFMLMNGLSPYVIKTSPNGISNSKRTSNK
jgi:hypothetical protein